MSKIIIVSVRVANAHQPSTGGLAVAVERLLEQQEVAGVWLGWNGVCVEDQASIELNVEDRGYYRALTFPFTQDQYDQFYCGYANTCLWPAFHYRLDLMNFLPQAYQQYLQVNQQIAQYLDQLAEPDDLIWIQDYHLIPLAHFCRERGMRQKIGLFLHTPFPCVDILKAVPRHEHWLPMLHAYDQVGLQSKSDHSALLTAMKIVSSGVKQRETRFGVYPIGIDVDLVQSMAESDEADLDAEGPSPHEPAPKTVISVDRLDYTKGLPQRFRTFSALLERYPDVKEQASYVQIAPSSRSDIMCYQLMQEELESLAGQINGQHATLNWTPIVYMNRAFPAPSLMKLLRQAQVGFISPLRDGMNLVAMEYVAAQDPDDPGVLVLSTFTGAAQCLDSGYLSVNPYDIDDTAQTLHKALHMPLAERQARHQVLLDQLREQCLGTWYQTFIRDLTGQPQPPQPAPAPFTPIRAS
ncbi:MAG: trehalose-6-phosphate synthase [Pigmentiphaga sp.]|nr:trehalose-6-phosphate synthase [Pigmentiphaga sp.]